MKQLPFQRRLLFRTLLCSLIPALALVGLSGLRPVVVFGSSMEPTLRPWQVAVLERDHYRAHPLERGDVVIFRWKGATYVKRVHALRGDEVTLIGSHNYSWAAGPDLVAKHVRLAQRLPYLSLRRVVVPPGHFFSLGDNQGASQDSRELGPIPMSALVGRVHSYTGAPLAALPS